jgi:hypothetical protein
MRSSACPGLRPTSAGPFPIVMVIVRKPGDEMGPGMVCPEGTQVTLKHAMEAARTFRDQLA